MAITGLTASHVVYDEFQDYIDISPTITTTKPGIWAANTFDSRHVASSASYNEHKIHGKTFIVEQTYPDFSFRNLGPEAVKSQMCKMLVDELFKRDSIEFTTMIEPNTGNVKVRARIFATENSDIQILRLNNLIK